MPENPKSQRNHSASANDEVEEAMARLEIQSNGGDTGKMSDEVIGLPDRPGEPDCIYYMRTGSCSYGSNCRFNHPSNGRQVNGNKIGELPERAGQLNCGHYLKTGTCKYGSTCKYNHPKEREADSSVSLNTLGLPLRQDAKPCPYYMRTGSCKYGYACKFHHPQPVSAANTLPTPAPFYSSGESVIVPNSGVQSTGEFSAASLPRASYLPNPFFPVPQNYTPLIISPSQGWNGYMGDVGPLSVSNVLTTPVSNGQLSVSHLPERPDQPECRYFMTHGSCKYGSDCKYHHPRERILQMTLSSLGPLGLPLRPGEPVCSYYSFYGLCKYGPNCKYDHPLSGGYPYGYNYGLPPMATPYLPSLPYQNMQSHLIPSQEAAAAAPLKISDWIKKGANASNKNQISNAKIVEDSPNGSTDSLEQSSKPLSEVVNESD